ncbi:hypothetical protein [Xenorhabdus lircayensis]|uniref:Type III secretion system effector EspK n=1 Tax=Xenorhabdus lircayensis TaxID=2763499 RepID=A0ABS0UA92_9GAMM|nr:hypothetical protein [Xenorhabdus lircayensis]MBI6550552.1 hypothetical protein [Xenorhabdus lircayensis]
MPFHQPFKTHLERGDFIFGLSEERTKYAKKYPQFAHFLALDNIAIIDQYSITHREIYVRQKYGHQIPSNQEPFEDAIKKHYKYKEILEVEHKSSINYQDGKVNYPRQVTSRKCKAGLSWIAHELHRSCIHFILDGINMESVINKYYEKYTKNKISYTGSELRWIYRNRRDPKVQSCTQFWRNGVPVIPPWVEGKDAALWQNYHPKFENSTIELGEFAETALNI